MLNMYLKLIIIIICTLFTPTYSVTFYEGFKWLTGNISTPDTGNAVTMSLKNDTGASGFISQAYYANGLFSANIKLLPQDYTAGIVVTFYKYLSNSLALHDEIDFEFLGHGNGKEWILQTNFFGNGSTDKGREERYRLWFDPSKEPHKYSIFWTENQIVYYIDEVPIRMVQKVDGGDYPSKPMALIGTIWDGSGWATEGGKLQANFVFEPFVAEYSGFVLTGCRVDPSLHVTVCGGSNHMMGFGKMTSKNLKAYTQFRKKYLTYSFCLDKQRYKNTLPECLVEPESGRLL